MFIKPDGKEKAKPEKGTKSQPFKKAFTKKEIKPLFSHFKGGTIEGKVIKASELPSKVDKALKPIKKVSDKMKGELKIYAKKRKEYLVSHTVCEVKYCNEKATTINHRKGRGIYLNDEKYFLAVCMVCHCEIENMPDWAKSQGYSLSRLSND